jgi:hypothetical protein
MTVNGWIKHASTISLATAALLGAGAGAAAADPSSGCRSAPSRRRPSGRGLTGSRSCTESR